MTNKTPVEKHDI